jgi:hypothetical protein
MEKSTLMIIGVVVFVYYVEKKGEFPRASELVVRYFILMFFICYFEYFMNGESVVFNMIVRRTLYMPSWLNTVYYDFYHDNVKMWFTQDVFLVQNITQRLFGRAYPVNSTGVISQSFFDGLIPSPNTGMFAEAYGQIGILGVVVFPFILSFLIRIIRRNIDWFGDGMTAVIMAKMVLQWISVSVLPSSNMIGVILIVVITKVMKLLYYNKQNVDNKSVVKKMNPKIWEYNNGRNNG